VSDVMTEMRNIKALRPWIEQLAANQSREKAFRDEVAKMVREIARKDALLIKARDLLERLGKADDDRCFMSEQEFLDVVEIVTEINKESK